MTSLGQIEKTAWQIGFSKLHCRRRFITHTARPSKFAPHILSPSQPFSITPRITEVRPQLLVPNFDLLRVLEHKEHPRPLCTRHVPPPMIRPPLHRHIASPHDPLHPIVKYHLHLSFNHYPIVERLRPVHQGLSAGSEIDHPRHGAVGIHQSQLVRLDDLVVGGEVGVAVHVGWEGGGGVDDVEGHRVVDPRRPGGGPVRLNDREPGGIVSGYVVRESWKAVGELGVVAGSRVGHGAGLKGRC